MPSILSLTGGFALSTNGVQKIGCAQASKQFTLASGNAVYEPKFSVLTTETTLQLGGMSAPFGVGWFFNLDPTNYLEIKAVASGKIFCKLLPNQFALIPLGSDVTAPVAIANSGTCLLEYAIFAP